MTWVEIFNKTNALACFYRPDAINHQVANEPVEGKEAIQQMFAKRTAM